MITRAWDLYACCRIDEDALNHLLWIFGNELIYEGTIKHSC